MIFSIFVPFLGFGVPVAVPSLTRAAVHVTPDVKLPTDGVHLPFDAILSRQNNILYVICISFQNPAIFVFGKALDFVVANGYSECRRRYRIPTKLKSLRITLLHLLPVLIPLHVSQKLPPSASKIAGI